MGQLFSLPVQRFTSSRSSRRYDARDLSRLHFVRRAQAMDFSLAEIAALLRMREQPQRARQGVRTLTVKKLAEVEHRLKELNHLHARAAVAADLRQQPDALVVAQRVRTQPEL